MASLIQKLSTLIRATLHEMADEAIQIQLGRWHSDLVSILDDVRRATGARLAAQN